MHGWWGLPQKKGTGGGGTRMVIGELFLKGREKKAIKRGSIVGR